MAFAGNRLRILDGLFFFIATAFLLYFGTGLDPMWGLLWIAPFPVLWFALTRSWWSAALVAGAAWMAGSLNLWGYFHTLGLPAATWFGASTSGALVFLSAVLLFRQLVRRGALWSALFGFPAVWIAFEYLRNLAWPHGTSGCLAYSQIRFLPLLQWASVAGPWGVGYVLLLFPAGLALSLFLKQTGQRQSGRVLGITAGTVAAVLAYGIARLAIPAPGPSVTVGLMALDRSIAPSGTPTEDLLTLYAERGRQLAWNGAKALVLPEKLGIVTPESLPAADRILNHFATDTGATVVAGLDREASHAAFNEARVYSPNTPPATYDKEHMLPPFEVRFTPGTEILTLPRQPAPWGVAICKDMDFTPLSRRYGRAGVGLMLVPAWDFNVDRAWHGHIAIMRGVEDGFSVARSARNGYLTVSDNRGRIIAETSSDSTRISTLLATVPAGHSWTVFQLLGDWFGWLSVILAAGAGMRLFWRQSRGV